MPVTPDRTPLRHAVMRISLTEEGGIRSAPSDPLRFCRDVLPLLPSSPASD